MVTAQLDIGPARTLTIVQREDSVNPATSGEVTADHSPALVAGPAGGSPAAVVVIRDDGGHGALSPPA